MDLAGAEKKLRQAMFFLEHLKIASRERVTGSPERLEYYFSACLTAAKSVYHVLQETGGSTFWRIQQDWRSRLSEPERSWFGRMMGLRDDDVHLGSTGAKARSKYVPEDPKNYVYWGPPVDAEVHNPDGTKVSGPVLRGAQGLYIERQGRLVEAPDACHEFIQRLTELLEAVKATYLQQKAEGSQS